MKRIFGILLTFALVFMAYCSLADTQFIQNVVMNDDSTSILIKSPVDDLPIQSVSLSIKETNKSLAIDRVQSVSSSTGVNTSWFFIVDTPYGRGNTVRLITRRLIESMKNGDNAQIIEVSSNKPIHNELTDNKNILYKKADELKEAKQKDAFDLVTAINTVVDNVKSYSTNTQERTCIVLISGFTNDLGSDYSFLEENLRNTRYTLYLIRLKMDGAPNVELISRYMGLTEKTPFCSMIELTNNKEEGANEAKNAVQEQEKYYKVIATGDETIKKGGTIVTKLTLNTRNFTEEYRLPFGFHSLEPVPTPSPEISPETPKPTPEPTPEPSIWGIITEFGKNNPLVLIFVALIIILSVVLGCLLIKGRKQNKAEENQKIQEDDENKNDENKNDVIHTEVETGIEVCLTSADGKIDRREFMNKSMAIGRNPSVNLGVDSERTDMIIPEKYTKISNCHVLLTYEHGIMYLEDVSTNGTEVNGTKVQGRRVPLKSGSKLTLAHIDFYINWK